MRKTLLTFALALSCYAAQAQLFKIKNLDDKNGFREARFGTDTTAFNDLVLVSRKGPDALYERTGDSKQIGGAEVESITYMFYKGKLSSVFIRTEGITNSQALLDALREQYGMGGQANRYIPRYMWYGTKVRMSYERNTASGDADVLIRSVEMGKIEDADSKQAAKKAKNDL